MLNIFKLKIKKSSKNTKVNSKNITKNPKKFGPYLRNWKNSIYAYNKNTLSNIPQASKLTNKLIQGYFNLFSLNLEKKIKNSEKWGKNIRRRKLSTHKILVSDGQFKHTNDLLDITIYFYNRQLTNYMSGLSKEYKKLFCKYYFKKKLFLIKNKGLNYLNYEKELKELFSNKKLDINTLDSNNYYKEFIKKSLKKEIIYMYFKQLIYINKYKFNNYYLQYLIKLVKRIYKKDIRFNFINVKYFYLNSDILTQSLILKLRKNRKKILSYFGSSVIKPRINLLKKKTFLQNREDSLKKIVLKNIGYKRISGIRLEASGRITRRFTASRSMTKIKYEGNLRNINSSLYKKSSALLRGNFRPNLEFTNLNSKTRIGSFGLKGWVSGV